MNLASKILVAIAAVALLPLSSPAQEPARAQAQEASARLIVIVKELEGTIPLGEARVRLIGPDGSALAPRMTDDAGRAAFMALVPGTYRIEIDRLGYRPVQDSLELEPQSQTTLDVELVPEALEMEPVLVATTQRRRSADMGGFDNRRRTGIGTYITRQNIEQSAPFLVSDMFRTVAGLRMVPVPGTPYMDVLMRGNCRPALVVDGVHMPHLRGLVLDHYFTPEDVEAIEIYRGPQTPPRFHFGPCGSIVVWTRVPQRTDRPFSWRRLFVAAGILAGALFLTR